MHQLSDSEDVQTALERAFAAWPSQACRGSVEYEAPASYCTRPPMQPWHMFCIDATINAVATGATASAAAAAAAAVRALQSNELARCAVVAYDDQVHFFGVQQAPVKHMVVSDIHVRI